MGAKITLRAILSLKIGKFWYFAIEVCSLWFDWWKVIIIEQSNYLRHKIEAKLQTITTSEILHSFDRSLIEVCSLGYDWWEVTTGLVYVSPVQNQVIIWTKKYWIQYCKHAALGEDELIYPKLLIICAPYLTCEAKILNIERCLISWGQQFILVPPATYRTNNIWIEFEIQAKFAKHWFKMYSTDHDEILHMSQRCNCRNRGTFFCDQLSIF